MDSPYSHADRSKVRQTVARVETLIERLKHSTKTGEAMPAPMAQLAYRLSHTHDQNQQIIALAAFAEEVKRNHIERLEGLAHDEFGAFCEVMSPDEPPAGVWLEFLTDLLQRIEDDTVLDDPRMARLAAEQGITRVHNLILNVPPGHAKPVHVDELVMMADGALKRLGEIEVGEYVIAGDGRAHEVVGVHKQGALRLVRVITESGRVLTAALDHPVEADGAFVCAGDLMPGHMVRVGSVGASWQPSNPMSPDMAAWVALTSFAPPVFGTQPAKRGGQHGLKGGQQHIYLRSTAQAEALYVGAKRLGLKSFLSSHAKGSVLTTSVKMREAIVAAGVDPWCPQAERSFPPSILAAGPDAARAFLTTFFDARGECVTGKNCLRDGPTTPNLRLVFAGEAYLRGVQHLLARFGVQAELVQAEGKVANPKLLLGHAATLRYLSEIGPYHGSRPDVLAESLAFHQGSTFAPWDGREKVVFIELAGQGECRCLTVAEHATFLASDLVVSNSTYSSRLFPAWRLGRNPDLKIVGAGHTQNFVEKEFSKRIRDMLDDPQYARIFPGIAIDASSRANEQWNIAGRRGQYVARGVGQAIHGFRFNFALIDDPYPSVTKAESAAYRREVETFVLKDIGTRMLPNGMTFVVMTRFHPEDITNRLLELNEDLSSSHRYLHIAVPAITFSEENDLLGRDYGERLWDFYSFEHFIEQRSKLGFRNYSLIHLQRTEAVDEGSLSSKFQYFTVAPHRTKAAAAASTQRDEAGRPIVDRSEFYKRVVLSTDMAAKETQRADWTVAQVWAHGRDGNHYLLAQIRFKAEFNLMVSRIEKMAKKWAVEQILVEDKGQGTAYIQARGKTKHQHRLAPAPLVPINPGQLSKSFRLDEVSPMIEGGEVWLPENAKWLPEFVTEVGQMSTEGGPAHDDQVDAMSQYLKWAKGQKRTLGTRKARSFG